LKDDPKKESIGFDEFIELSAYSSMPNMEKLVIHVHPNLRTATKMYFESIYKRALGMEKGGGNINMKYLVERRMMSFVKFIDAIKIIATKIGHLLLKSDRIIPLNSQGFDYEVNCFVSLVNRLAKPLIDS
jgi:hypothetical protein